MTINKCSKCGYTSNREDFVYDYVYDADIGDEVPVYKCPKCGEMGTDEDDDFMEDVE